jgi:hypothetical protein
VETVSKGVGIFKEKKCPVWVGARDWAVVEEDKR